MVSRDRGKAVEEEIRATLDIYTSKLGMTIHNTTMRVKRIERNGWAMRVGLREGDKLVSCGLKELKKTMKSTRKRETSFLFERERTAEASAAVAPWLQAQEEAEQGEEQKEEKYSSGSGDEESDSGGVVEAWLLDAKRGSSVALTKVALCYAQGLGVPKSRRVSVSLLERASSIGEPQATLLLGMLAESRSQKTKARQLFAATAKNGGCSGGIAAIARDRLHRFRKEPQNGKDIPPRRRKEKGGGLGGGDKRRRAGS